MGRNVMLDLETLGTEPGCVILSIGAVTFDPKGVSYGYQFECNMDAETSQAIGFTTSPETVAWWSRQSKEARDRLLIDRVNILTGLESFVQWFRDVQGKQLWCQGANFDEPILRRALDMLKIPVPWKYYDVRDTRTAYEIYGFNPKFVKREGTHHSALDDAAYQSKCLQEAFKCQK